MGKPAKIRSEVIGQKIVTGLVAVTCTVGAWAVANNKPNADSTTDIEATLESGKSTARKPLENKLQR